jgi:ubiquinol-cytochrome c reductase iron-sulfur subunit
MSKEGVDKGRRRFLTAATSVVGAVGAGFVVAPFVISMEPSARAQAAGAPVEADISKIEPGQMITIEWRGKPVWIVHRTEQNLEDLPSNDPRLTDPNSDNTAQQPTWAKNEFRSQEEHKAILVLVGICTHLGCSPTYRPDLAPADLGPDWKGGFFCPCHGSRFDLAGRVLAGSPAPKNLQVPPYKFLSDTRIIVGVDKGAA